MLIWATVIEAVNDQANTNGLNLSRHNLGVAFVPVKKVHVYSTVSKVVFMVELPPLEKADKGYYNCATIQSRWFQRHADADSWTNQTGLADPPENITWQMTKHSVPNFLPAADEMSDARFLNWLPRYVIETGGIMPTDLTEGRKTAYMRYVRENNETVQGVLAGRQARRLTGLRRLETDDLSGLPIIRHMLVNEDQWKNSYVCDRVVKVGHAFWTLQRKMINKMQQEISKIYEVVHTVTNVGRRRRNWEEIS